MSPSYPLIGCQISPRLGAFDPFGKIAKQKRLQNVEIAQANNAQQLEVARQKQQADAVEAFRKKLGELMPKGPWLYPEDQISDAPLRSLAAEITREKIFERLHDELPYQITVETEQWKEMPDGSARLEQTIYVTRDAHKKIVIGEQGQMLKSIGMSARKDIAEAAETKIHLFLFVKVRENWIDDPERYREMGLEFPKN
jgi:GTP-binding protein Era